MYVNHNGRVTRQTSLVPKPNPNPENVFWGRSPGDSFFNTPVLCHQPSPDIVEMIIPHLTWDIPSLHTCSLTCCSWYIATVLRLHRTLTIQTSREAIGRFRWPSPLLYMHRLRLLPMVSKLQFLEGCDSDSRGFSTNRFNCCLLYRFFALTNVQELEIDLLDIPKFMPRIRRYFKNFLPTLRSLTLREPDGCRRQIIYFIGLFQHLEDLKLLFEPRRSYWGRQEIPQVNLALIPAFAPPLRGRLTMSSFGRCGLLEDMVHLFGEIRFRYMDLFNVADVQLLLNACGGTLETLRLYPTC